MNIGNVLLWGFAATLVLTNIMTAGRTFHLTRIDIPFILGTLWTDDRDKARWSGFSFHFMFGWLFAFIYAAAMDSAGIFTWWFGAIIGVVHGSFVLIAGMGIVSSIHPRMASEDRGPEPTRMLEPPGFMVLNYGKGTPIATMIAHVIYGAIIGTFYHP
ncbi:MAG: hypothetical protein ACJ76H_11570 [Bacteriovoracaceae bacterium]